MHFDHLKRRELITLIGGTVAAWPLTARAQDARPKQAVLAWLTTGSKTASDRYFAGLDQGLEELGYRKGSDYQVVDRYAEGDAGRLPQLAKELVQLRPDLILAGTTPATLAVRGITGNIPIVGVNMNDPVGMGLARSEAHPGSNVTGILVRVEGQSAKQLEIARDAVPGVSKIGILFNPGNPSNLRQRQEIEAAAARLGLNLTVVAARTADDIGPAFRALLGDGANIAVVLGDATFVSLRRQIAAFALAMHVPTVFTFREHVEDGGFISYGINLHENYRRAAYFVDRILKGDKPADLPIEFPVKLELVVNIATAKALGLDIRPALIARADEVIE